MLKVKMKKSIIAIKRQKTYELEIKMRKVKIIKNL